MATLAVWLLLSGCTPAPFPPSPASTGVRDVPFVETYNFDFPSGAVDRGSKNGRDRSGDLRIFSAADLRNLLSAANVTLETNPNKPSGVLNGFTLFGSFPIPRVVLDVRDFDGNPVPDVFYNGLGGVPDFVAVDGTADQGSFTIFNVPEGEAFLVASNGGRGSGHVGVFANAISVKPLDVIPVLVADVGVTGPITDLITGINVFPVELSALGLQKRPRYSDDRGLLQLAPLVGFRVLLPSNSEFLIKTASPDLETTYQTMNTNLSDLGDAVDLTRFPQMLSTEQLNTWMDSNGLVREPGTGTLVMLFTGAQDSPQVHNRFTVRNFAGQEVGLPFQGLFNLNFGRIDAIPRGSAGFEDATYVLAFNVPPGPAFVRGASFIDNAGFQAGRVGADTVEIFEDGVTFSNMPVADASIPNNLVSPVLTSLQGTVTLSDLVSPVRDVVIDIGGYAGGPGAADGPIRSQTRFVGDEYFIDEKNRTIDDPFDHTKSNLPLKGNYIARVSNLPGQSHYVDTYQRFHTQFAEVRADATLVRTQNFQVFTRTEVENMGAVAGVTLDPTRGILIGRTLDTFSGNTPGGIEIQVLNTNGDPVGEVRYMDAQGLPQRLGSTSNQGEFVAFNVPEGLVLVHVVSQDDSGSISTRVFPGGVTNMGLVPVGDAPKDRVIVTGATSDLTGTPIPGARLIFHGELPAAGAGQAGFFTTNVDGSGRFQAELGVFGDYLVSVNPDVTFFRTINEDLNTQLSPINSKTLFGVKRDTVTAAVAAANAAGGNITLDPGLGVIVGEAVVKSWVDRPESTQLITEGITGPTAISAALLNGDGVADLIVANGAADEVSVYFGSEDGTFEFAGSYRVGLSPIDLLGTDVDGDGVGDILVLNQGSGDITVLLGTVRGIFREDPSRRILVGTGPIKLRRGDMDGDGSRDDLVVLNRTANTVSVFFRNDDRRYEEAPYSPSILGGSQPASLGVQDLTRARESRGRLAVAPPLDDVVVAMEGSDTIEVFFNGGDDLFRQLPLGLPSGARPVDVIRADINRDGDPLVDRDLEYIVLNRGINNIQVIEIVNDSPAFIQSDLQLDPGCSPRSMSGADTNSDGRFDLVVLCAGTNTMAVYLGQVDGTFVPWQCDSADCRFPALPTGNAPSDLATGAFDLRGGVDTAVVSEFSDTLKLFYGDEVPIDKIHVAVADLEGNPVPDVLYLDGNGQFLPGTSTDSSGRFMAVNVPAGNIWANAADGDNGNRRFIVFPDTVTHAKLKVTGKVSTVPITLRGQVNDAVSSPQANIEVRFAGSGLFTVTDNELAASGVYELSLPSNHNDGVMRLSQP